MMHKLFDIFGEYVPGFFSIKLAQKLTEENPWGNFTQEQLATFVHEYIHFIQDISTTRGLSCFEYVSQIIQLNFAKAYESGAVISLPISLESCTGSDAYVASELQSFYAGENGWKKIHHINRVCREPEDLISEIAGESLNAINVYYNDLDIPYQFGADCIAESMAYIIESELFGGMRRTKEFPYNLCELLCEKLCPALLSNKAVLVAACELSLMHFHSGDMFWHILNEIGQKKLHFNDVSGFELYFLPKTSFLFQDMEKMFRGIANIVNFLYPLDVHELVEPHEKAEQFLRHGFAFRQNEKLFVAKMMEHQHPGKVINMWMRYFGMPLLYDSDGSVFGTGNVSMMMAPVALYNFFVQHDHNCCSLIPYCSVQNLDCYDYNRCMNTPWEQAGQNSLCPFALYWHKYSLTGKVVDRHTFISASST